MMSCLLFTWQAFLTLARDIKAKMDTKLVGISLSELLEFAFWAKMFCLTILFFLSHRRVTILRVATMESKSPLNSRKRAASFAVCYCEDRGLTVHHPEAGRDWTMLSHNALLLFPPLSLSRSRSASSPWAFGVPVSSGLLPLKRCHFIFRDAIVVRLHWLSSPGEDLMRRAICYTSECAY